MPPTLLSSSIVISANSAFLLILRKSNSAVVEPSGLTLIAPPPPRGPEEYLPNFAPLRKVSFSLAVSSVSLRKKYLSPVLSASAPPTEARMSCFTASIRSWSELPVVVSSSTRSTEMFGRTSPAVIAYLKEEI